VAEGPYPADVPRNVPRLPFFSRETGHLRRFGSTSLKIVEGLSILKDGAKRQDIELLES